MPAQYRPIFGRALIARKAKPRGHKACGRFCHKSPHSLMPCVQYIAEARAQKAADA